MLISLDTVTGARLQSTAYARAAVDVLQTKLQSTEVILLQWSNNGSGVPCAAPGMPIRVGMKPLEHYSDATFELYTDQITAPADPTLPDAYYTASMVIDSDALRALFPVATDGTSPDYVPLMCEVLAGSAPSQTFPVVVYNNVIKDTESPAIATPGQTYPAPAVVNTLAAHAYRDYAGEAADAVDSRLAGKTPGAGTQAIFNADGTRNGTAWFADFQADLTCQSSASSSGWRVTALCPGWVMSAAHVGSLAGTTATFTPNDGTPAQTRTLGAQHAVVGDLVLYPLDSDLPTSIRPATLLPPNVAASVNFAGCPVLYTDQLQRGYVADLLSLDAGTPMADTLGVPHEARRAAFCKTSTSPAVQGDSSSAYFLVLAGRLVCLGVFFFGDGEAPDPGANAAAIQAIIGSGYALCFAALPLLSNTAYLTASDHPLPGQVVRVPASGVLPHSILPADSAESSFHSDLSTPAGVSAIASPVDGQLVVFADADQFIHSYRLYVTEDAGLDGVHVLSSTTQGAFWFLESTFDPTGSESGTPGATTFPGKLVAEGNQRVLTTGDLPTGVVFANGANPPTAATAAQVSALVSGDIAPATVNVTGLGVTTAGLWLKPGESSFNFHDGLRLYPSLGGQVVFATGAPLAFQGAYFSFNNAVSVGGTLTAGAGLVLTPSALPASGMPGEFWSDGTHAYCWLGGAWKQLDS